MLLLNSSYSGHRDTFYKEELLLGFLTLQLAAQG